MEEPSQTELMDVDDHVLFQIANHGEFNISELASLKLVNKRLERLADLNTPDILQRKFGVSLSRPRSAFNALMKCTKTELPDNCFQHIWKMLQRQPLNTFNMSEVHIKALAQSALRTGRYDIVKDMDIIHTHPSVILNILSLSEFYFESRAIFSVLFTRAAAAQSALAIIHHGFNSHVIGRAQLGLEKILDNGNLVTKQVLKLIDGGADINTPGRSTESLVSQVIEYGIQGSDALLQELIDRGADLYPIVDHTVCPFLDMAFQTFINSIFRIGDTRNLHPDTYKQWIDLALSHVHQIVNEVGVPNNSSSFKMINGQTFIVGFILSLGNTTQLKEVEFEKINGSTGVTASNLLNDFEQISLYVEELQTALNMIRILIKNGLDLPSTIEYRAEVENAFVRDNFGVYHQRTSLYSRI